MQPVVPHTDHARELQHSLRCSGRAFRARHSQPTQSCCCMGGLPSRGAWTSSRRPHAASPSLLVIHMSSMAARLWCRQHTLLESLLGWHAAACSHALQQLG